MTSLLATLLLALGVTSPADAAPRRTDDVVLRVATYNLWYKAVAARPADLEDDIVALTETAKVVGFQEAGDAEDIIRRAAARTGYKIYIGRSDRTTLLYNPNLSDPVTRTFQLSGHVWVGDDGGAGPEMLEEKWLNVVSFTYGGRRIHVGVLHAVPSQTLNETRSNLARVQFSNAADAMSTLQGVKLVMGDFNNKPDAEVRAPLYSAGFRSTQDTLGWKGTFIANDSPIDDVLVRAGSRMDILGSETREGASDHRAFIGSYLVHRPTP